MSSDASKSSFEIVKKALTNSKNYSSVEHVSSSSKKGIRKKKVAPRHRKKKVARRNRKKKVGMTELEERSSEETVAAEIPDEPYDPLENLPPSKYLSTDISDALKHVYIQPKMSNNGINIVEMIKENSHSFYLFDIPDERKDMVTKCIEELGGTVTTELGKANRVLFYSTKKMKPNSLFKFAICAMGGRFLLHASYIFQSYDQKKFLDVNYFCSLENFSSRFDIDAPTLAAIEMSIKFRADYAKKKVPVFFRHNILFAVSETRYADIKLLLEILGAHVQSFHPEGITNHLFTLCVADKKNHEMTYGIKDIIPQTTTKDLRELVWKTYRKFLRR